MRGRKPKPTHLRVLEGNLGKRALNRGEPKTCGVGPACPRWLTGDARKAFHRMTGLLRGLGILTLADRDAIEAYAQTNKRWREAETFLAKSGLVYPLRDEQGNVKCMQQWPHVSIARNCIAILRAYQVEFGLTPSARSRIDFPGADEGRADWLPPELCE